MLETTKMKRHLGRLYVSLLVIAVHFSVSAMIGYHVANQVGSDTENVVVGAFYVNANEQSQRLSDQDAHMLYNDMNLRIERNISTWKIPLKILSLPIKPLLKPIRNRLLYSDYQEVVAKRMSPERFLTRRNAFAYLSFFINSVVIGLCVYIGIRTYSVKRPHNQAL